MATINEQTAEVNGHTVKLNTNVEIRPGYSPYIGANGNWYWYDITVKGFVDTGISAQGPAGESSIVDIYVDGTSLVIDTNLINGNEVSY